MQFLRRTTNGATMRRFVPTALRLVAIIFVIEFIVGTAPSSMVRAQSTDGQTVCTARALSTFQDLGREYRAVLERLNVPFEIKSSDYQAFYSSKIDRCLLTVRKTTSIMRESSDMSYLIDADTRQMYAVYIETDGKMESCSLIPSAQATSTCNDRAEFDAFIREYMEQ
jgi:hypothetical protein